MITPAFHFQILDDFMRVFNTQSRILCDLLSQKCSRLDNKDQKGEFDIYPYILNCTLDVICGKVQTLYYSSHNKEMYLILPNFKKRTFNEFV